MTVEEARLIATPEKLQEYIDKGTFRDVAVKEMGILQSEMCYLERETGKYLISRSEFAKKRLTKEAFDRWDKIGLDNYQIADLTNLQVQTVRMYRKNTQKKKRAYTKKAVTNWENKAEFRHREGIAKDFMSLAIVKPWVSCVMPVNYERGISH